MAVGDRAVACATQNLCDRSDGGPRAAASLLVEAPSAITVREASVSTDMSACGLRVPHFMATCRATGVAVPSLWMTLRRTCRRSDLQKGAAVNDRGQPYFSGDLVLDDCAVLTRVVEFLRRSDIAEVVGGWYVARKVPVDWPEQQNCCCRTFRHAAYAGHARYSSAGFA